MSWQVIFVGQPDNVVKALEDHSAKLNGQSKTEYDAALPNLVGIVKENFGSTAMLKITAAGSGYAVDGVQKNRTCTVSVELWYGTIV